MPGCEICGGRFAEHRCIFCNRTVCSSCMAPETGKCRRCSGVRRLPLGRFVRRNMILFIVLGLIWTYTVYPWPFLHAFGLEFDMSVIQPILIVSIVLAIPFVFMMRAWQKRPPPS